MISIALDNQGWGGETDWEALADRAVRAALALSAFAALADDARAIEVSVTLSSDEEVHALNRQWRDKDKPTNVLSFPMTAPDEVATLPLGMEAMLGDIILAQGVCAREAAEKRIPFSDHATHLVVHGTLHLLGYDHMDEQDAEEMEALERRVLANLGISDPYIGDER